MRPGVCFAGFRILVRDDSPAILHPPAANTSGKIRQPTNRPLKTPTAPWRPPSVCTISPYPSATSPAKTAISLGWSIIPTIPASTISAIISARKTATKSAKTAMFSAMLSHCHNRRPRSTHKTGHIRGHSSGKKAATKAAKPATPHRSPHDPSPAARERGWPQAGEGTVPIASHHTGRPPMFRGTIQRSPASSAMRRTEAHSKARTCGSNEEYTHARATRSRICRASAAR